MGIRAEAAHVNLQSEIKSAALAQSQLHRRLLFILRMNSHRQLANNDVEAESSDFESRLEPVVKLVASPGNR